MTYSAPVNATNNTINLTEFPELIGTAFTIDSEIGGMLLSSLVLVSIGLALAYLKAKGLILIAVEFVAMGSLIMLGWLPSFFMLVIVVVVALEFAGKVRKSL